MSNDIYNVDADMDQQSATDTVTSLQRNNIVNDVAIVSRTHRRR